MGVEQGAERDKGEILRDIHALGQIPSGQAGVKMDCRGLQQLVTHALEEKIDVGIHQRQVTVGLVVERRGDIVLHDDDRPLVGVDDLFEEIDPVRRVNPQLFCEDWRGGGEQLQLAQRRPRRIAAAGDDIDIRGVNIQPGGLRQNIAVDQRPDAALPGDVSGGLQLGENIPDLDPADAQLPGNVLLRRKPVLLLKTMA